MFTAHALRSEKLGIMALCWRHDAFANVTESAMDALQVLLS